MISPAIVQGLRALSQEDLRVLIAHAASIHWEREPDGARLATALRRIADRVETQRARADA